MLTLGDIQELLGLEVLGVVPESKSVLTATNLGQPVIMTEGVSSEQKPNTAIGSKSIQRHLS